MFWIRVEDGKPIGNAVIESNLRAQFPNKQLPMPLEAKDVKDLGYEPYIPSEPPTHEIYEKAVNPDPVLRGDGIWIQQWSIEAMSDEEKAEIDKSEAVRMRQARNNLLYLSDWSQLADAPLQEKDSEWIAYRQALRDVPEQAGFPHNITWPTEPNVLAAPLRDRQQVYNLRAMYYFYV